MRSIYGVAEEGGFLVDVRAIFICDVTELMDFRLLYEGSLCLGFRLAGVLSPYLLLVIIICGGCTI
jgi:hypothetical protein